MGPQSRNGATVNPQAIAQMLQQLQGGGQPPLDLTTGQPATAPPIGSNPVPAAGGMPPLPPQNVVATGQATRNSGIYPR